MRDQLTLIQLHRHCHSRQILAFIFRLVAETVQLHTIEHWHTETDYRRLSVEAIIAPS